MEDVAAHHLEKNLGCPEQLGDQETTKDCTEAMATGRNELSQWRSWRRGGRLPTAGVEPMETTSPLDKLREGFQHFNEEIYQKKRKLFQELSQGQKPKYMIIACSDSRVCPSNVMQLQPGEAFMVRNIANMVPPYDKVRYSEVGAAIEYAVTHLKVQNIVVLGHSSCGGIKGLMALRDDATTSSSFVDNWVKIGLPAKKKVKEAYPSISEELQHAKCEVESVNVSLGNLLTYPFVKERVNKKSLLLYGGYYNFFEGSLEFWGTPAKII